MWSHANRNNEIKKVRNVFCNIILCYLVNDFKFLAYEVTKTLSYLECFSFAYIVKCNRTSCITRIVKNCVSVSLIHSATRSSTNYSLSSARFAEETVVASGTLHREE